MRFPKSVLVLLAVTTLAVAGCSSDSSSESTTSDVSLGDSTDMTDSSMAACPDETELEIVTGESDVQAFPVVTSWADEGPHPDNTVDYDSQMSFLFSTDEVEEDPQFGWSIPMPGTEVADGAIEFQVSLASNGDIIEVGDTFVDQTADDETLAQHDGIINFISLYEGTERFVLGDSVLTITEITDDTVCGQIDGVSVTELQELTIVNGSFIADRIQAIEAE